MAERLLVISPHCDDAEISCAGYIAKTIAEWGEVMTLVVSASDVWFEHADRTVSRAERVEEFENACHVLGVQKHMVLDFEEGELGRVPTREIVSALDRVIAAFGPTEILLPLPSSHPDHTAVHELSVAACRMSPSKQSLMLVASYEYPLSSWGPGGDFCEGKGGMYVNITEFMDKKKEALNCYESQMRSQTDLISVYGCEALAKLRGIESGFDFAEMFHVMRRRVR